MSDKVEQIVEMIRERYNCRDVALATKIVAACQTTRPTVDQIAAVLRQAGQVYDVQKWAAEIAALWAGEETPIEREAVCAKLTRIMYAERVGSVSNNDVANVILDAIDARIDAKMGATPTKDEESNLIGNDWLPILHALDRFFPDWRFDNDDANTHLGTLGERAIRALHARAEAAERELHIERARVSMIANALSGEPLASTPTGAARE